MLKNEGRYYSLHDLCEELVVLNNMKEALNAMEGKVSVSRIQKEIDRIEKMIFEKSVVVNRDLGDEHTNH